VRESEVSRVTDDQPPLRLTGYCIAKVSHQAKDFESIRRMLRARQGKIPDSNKILPTAGKIGSTPLGLLDE
jgi:hypothetical protein